MRDLIARIIYPVMRITGYRFSKAFRQDDGGWRKFVYRHIVNTVLANVLAGI